MRKPGINLTVGLLLLVVTFGISAPALWGAAQIVKSEDAEEEAANGGAGGAGGGPVDVTVVSENLLFDTDSITASTGVDVTITHDNRDAGVLHNVAFYTDSSAASEIHVSELITGPAEDVFTFSAPATAGEYFFRCDVHPDTMTGTFAVQ